MKINLKAGEHIRIAHDGAAFGDTFQVYIERGAVHVRALVRGEKTDLVIGQGVSVNMEVDGARKGGTIGVRCCIRCGHDVFIDGGETCAKCKLVQ